MTINFLHRPRLGAIVVDAWQKRFETRKDPAAGQWFSDDPAGNGGLFGNLTDELAPALAFDPAARTFGVHKMAVATGLVDNRNGQSAFATVDLSHTCRDSVTTSHLVSKLVRTGLPVLIKDKLGPDVFGHDFDVTFAADYVHSWADATAVTDAAPRSVNLAVPVRNVPKGRVYQVMLLAHRQMSSVPYRADIILKGMTTAHFAHRVEGERVWRATAGDLCEWVNRHDSAGDDSWFFSRDPLDPTQGRVSLHGMLRAVRYMNFSVQMIDVTEDFDPDLVESAYTPMLKAVSEGRVVDEVLVDERVAA